MVEEPKEIINPVQEEQPKISIDYLVGLYDIRGLIVFDKSNHVKGGKPYIRFTPNIYIIVDYNNKDIVEGFKRITKGKIIMVHRNNRRKPMVQIRNLKGIRDFLLAIEGKTILKKEHSKRLLEYVESRMSRMRSRLNKDELRLIREITMLNKYLPLPEREELWTILLFLLL